MEKKPFTSRRPRARERAATPDSTLATTAPISVVAAERGAWTPALYASIVEHAPDALIVADASAHILLANAQTEALFGYTQTELLGWEIERLIPQRFRETHQTHRAAYATHPHTRPMGANLEMFGQRRDGSEFPVEVSLSPLLTGDELVIICAVRDVTARKRLEREYAAASQSMRLQSLLVERAHDAIIVRDHESHIMSWNRGAEEIYGWPASEVTGQITHTLLHTRFPVSRDALEKALAGGGQWEGELEHRARDGRMVFVESRQEFLSDELGLDGVIVEINRDITERKRQEVAASATYLLAERRRALLQYLSDELPGGVYVVRGRDARLVLANHAIQVMWGTEWRTGQPMADFVRAAGLRYYAENGRPVSVGNLLTLRILHARNGRGLRMRQRQIIRRADGVEIAVLFSAVRIDSALAESESDSPVAPMGRPDSKASATPPEPAALVLLQDISAIRETERLKDEFISMAAHELRTPLSAVRGFADMLNVQTAHGHGPALADWQQDAIYEIETASLRLDKLVEDLLDVTRIQAGRLSLKMAPLDLVDLVRHSVARARLTAPAHTITLETPNAPALLAADGLRLEQVLGNLLSNAIKYSPGGGPIEIHVVANPGRLQAEVRVRDHGIGIPSSAHAQLFQRFSRASNAQDHQIAGTGLGLYISRELVSQHGGQLWFESVEGQGATFYLTLPLLDSHSATSASQEREARPTSPLAPDSAKTNSDSDDDEENGMDSAPPPDLVTPPAPEFAG